MKKFTTYLMVGTALAATACSPAGAAGDMDKKQVEAIVQDYIKNNPEIIRDALEALAEREEEAAWQAMKKAIISDKRDAVIGPKNAKVTIVEFFDYNCGFCKRSTEWLSETIDANPKDVRVIFKELPLLDGRTKTSRNAAKAALAADKQGKYREMHFALMEERSLTSERINDIAKKAGLNMKLFERDMADADIENHIEDTMDLAASMPMFTGTPFFMINDEYVSGADTERLQELLEAELGS